MVGDLEVAARDLHLPVDGKRSPKLLDRFLEQSLLIVDHPEVVERPCVPRVDSLSQRPQNAQVTFRLHPSGHASA